MDVPHQLPDQPPERIAFPLGLRLATEADEDAIFDLISLQREESGFSHLVPEKLWDMIRKGTYEKDAIIVVIQGSLGIEATACLDLETLWYSSEPIYVDRWIFVRPDCRRSHHAETLLRFFRWWAQESGVPVHFGILSETRLAAKARFFARYGKMAGAGYLVEPRAVTPVPYPSDVRIGTPDDEGELFSFGLAALQSDGFGEVNHEKLWAMIKKGTRAKKAVVAFIRGPDGIEASVGLDPITEWYSDQWLYVDRWVYVHPDHRRSNHARNLLKFIRWFSRETNSPVSFGILSNKRFKAKSRFYSGFARHIGAGFLIMPTHEPLRMAS